MKIRVRLLSLSAIALTGLLAFSSCGNKDDEPAPNFAAPVLTVAGDASATLKPGATVEVNLNINAEGGLRSIIVNRNGGFLEEIDLADPMATTYQYTGDAVPDSAIEGEEITYEFIGVNTRNTQSVPAGFMVSVAVYDLVNFNSVVGDVYEVAIPTDGNVAQGSAVTFSSGRSYYVSSSLNFEDGSSLTIEEGVTLYLNADADAPVFVEIQPAASLSIQGTAAAPVVMTSSRLITGDTPEPGDWETFELEGTAGSSISYLRIEYANEGFRVDDCDDSNKIEYVSVFRTAGEGMYITGGNVGAKYLASIETGDSNFRLGDDYTGNLQFLIAYNAGGGGEAFYLRENSNVTIANVTVVGPGATTNMPPDEFENAGIRFRSTTGGKVYNAVVTGMPDWGVRAQEAVPTDINGPVVLAYSHVYDNASRDDDDAVIFFTEASFMNSEEPIEGITVGSVAPNAVVASEFDPASLGGFYSPAAFKGAVQDAGNDWTAGWVRNPDGSMR